MTRFAISAIRRAPRLPVIAAAALALASCRGVAREPALTGQGGAASAPAASPGAVAPAASPPPAAPRTDGPFAGADLAPRPPVLPLTPAQQQSRFLLPPGFRIEPVLAEPQIEQPGAIAFDGDGRMYVLELRTYMLDPEATDQLAPVSRISRWEDGDGDGRFERHTVFVDSLVFPRFVTPFGSDAVLTKESNQDEVWKYTDTDRDGVADRRELFTSNFGRLANVEHQEASLFWAMDNWMYSTVNAFRVRWTPTGVIREPTGYNSAQWGATQDDEGKVWFQGGASGLPSFYQHPIHYGNLGIPDAFEIGMDVPWGAPVRIADMQGGMGAVRMPDGSLNRVTAGSGNDVFRGHRLPGDLRGDYFYGEPVARIVRRLRPSREDGVTRLRNVYQPERSEFLRSTDPLFRPVEVETAPDGTMYVVDMYHGIIQESQWAGPGSYLRAKIDQYRLGDVVRRGRIWRITHESVAPDPARPRMLSETPSQLVRHLEHPNGWWRDMAQQLLVLRQDRSVAPALKAMARSGTTLVGRFHALWTLEGLGALDAALARELMRDENPRMRIQAIRASESLYKAGDPSFASDYRALANDRDQEVVVQALLTLRYLRVQDVQEVTRAAATRGSPGRGLQLVAQHILHPTLPSGVGAGNTPMSSAQRVVWAQGERVYREQCAQCHGEQGLGVPAGDRLIAPPLAGSPRVAGHPDYVVKTLLHGLSGPIEGQDYAGGVMVAHGEQSDEWIAAVASYVRNSMTNQASFIGPRDVARVRAAQRERNSPWEYARLAAETPVRLRAEASWKFSASHATSRAERAFNTSGWTTGSPQTPGMWYQFELPAPILLTDIVFDSPLAGGPVAAGATRPSTTPRGYRVQLSLDGSTWAPPVAEGQGAPGRTTISFPATLARAVRITQTGAAPDGAPWTMQTMELYHLAGAR